MIEIKVIKKTKFFVRFYIKGIDPVLLLKLKRGSVRIKKWTLMSRGFPEVTRNNLLFVWGSNSSQNDSILKLGAKRFKTLTEELKSLGNPDTIEQEFFQRTVSL